MQIATLRSLGTTPSEIIPPVVSIVIPTLNHLNDFLKPCIESIVCYTDMSRVEVIVVANGCTDGTEDYVRTLGPSFKLVHRTQPLGYTAASNLGIREAKGEYVLLLNNDTVLLEQPKNAWLNLLLHPFKWQSRIGITGPVKFNWDCGGTSRTAIAFWCAMIPRRLFTELGYLDEIFSPGMGEDGDFSIKVEQAGYALVQVPNDESRKFGTGIGDRSFPIYHKGSGTFGEKDYSEISKKNTKILERRYGKRGRLDEIYDICINHQCDTNQLFPLFRQYAERCDHVTEFGVRGVFSTYGFLVARPPRMVSYDTEYCSNIEEAKTEAARAGISFDFVQADDLKVEIEPTDLLFIDTKHTYSQLKQELALHAPRTRKYILVHDTTSFGVEGEDGGEGENRAINEFIAESGGLWRVELKVNYSNGLTVLAREPENLPLVSIIIPTYNHFEDALKPCIEAVLRYTDLSDKEVIVVANGSPQATLDFLKDKPIRVLTYPEAIGYIRAVNAGIQASRGKYIVTLDDDSFLQPQDRDQWVRALLAPLTSDPQVAAASPFSRVYEDLGQVLHSGCTIYLKSALQQVGLFDEAFNPGYMGDEDLSIRLRKAGYTLSEVPKGLKNEYVEGLFRVNFPVVHMGNVNTMPKYTTDLPLVAKNRELLYRRHRPHSKVSIIIPTYNHLQDLLKPNLESIIEYTNLADVEVIVVANGCTDGTEDYVRTLGPSFKLLSFPEPLGFTKATNEGIKISSGDFVILFNNDNLLLGQPKNLWIDLLLEPFTHNPKMGITGPLQLHDDYADEDVVIGFCLCVSRQALDAAGGCLDEIFSPGGGEDIDICCKVRRQGYVVRQVPREGKLGFSHTNTGEFPIWHKNNQTFKDITEYTRWYVKRNGCINMKRYNKDIKLNLGAGGVEYQGYLSVDLHDNRASIIMDVTKLDLEDNSVSEILASHLFEHLNPYKALDTLKEWHRVLKPGGKLVMEMPDIEQLCKRFVSANTGERYGILNAVYGSVNTTSEGDPSEITSPHLFGWWPDSIRDHLFNAGFLDIQIGPEQIPHPESNFRVEATKPGVLVAEAPQEEPGKCSTWAYANCPEPSPYGSDDTYLKAMKFLEDCDTVEDWGCGTTYARRFRSSGKYIGVDSSPSKFCDVVADLTQYKSQADGILVRHVLEHNFNWKQILENASQSFRKKMVVVLFTPMVGTTTQIATNSGGVPDLSFCREDLVRVWGDTPFVEEHMTTQTQYGEEHIFYLSKVPAGATSKMLQVMGA